MGWLSGLEDWWERRQRAKPYARYLDGACHLACSSMDDEDARRVIEQRVPFDKAGITRAVEGASRTRSDYLSDRQFRPLSAIADRGPVRPIDPFLAELFTQERELGQMRVADAFTRLAELEPRLRSVEQEPAPPRGPDTSDYKEFKRASRAAAAYTDPLRGLVGVAAKKRLPILMSDISAPTPSNTCW